jgi:hypothetical protein
LERLASKWRVLLIYALLAGPQRHAQLRRRVAGITQKVLTETRWPRCVPEKHATVGRLPELRRHVPC